jgi:hypothetical protein
VELEVDDRVAGERLGGEVRDEDGTAGKLGSDGAFDVASRWHRLLVTEGEKASEPKLVHESLDALSVLVPLPRVGGEGSERLAL